jgi:hypothetical protein
MCHLLGKVSPFLYTPSALSLYEVQELFPATPAGSIPPSQMQLLAASLVLYSLTRGGAWGQPKGGKLAVKRRAVYLFYSRLRDPIYLSK